MVDTAAVSSHDFRVARALWGLTDAEIDRLRPYLRMVEIREGDEILHESDSDRSMFFVLEGAAAIRRGDLDLGRWEKGEHFGELALISGRPRAATVIAATDMRLLRLGAQEWERLRLEAPAIAVRLLEGLLANVGRQLTEMTDTVSSLMRQRSVPRHLAIHLRHDHSERVMPTGVHPADVLPSVVDGYPVVAALLDNTICPLDTPIGTDSQVSPLTTGHWEGQRIYRRSAALMALEAACELEPQRVFTLGSSLGSQQWISISPWEGLDREDLARRVEQRMREYVEQDVPFRHEWWTVGEAGRYFEEQGWTSTARLLQTSRETAVGLVSCGKLYALSIGALASNAGRIDNFSVRAMDGHLLLVTGGGEEASASAASTAYADILHQNENWLRSMGVHGVGEFNHVCVGGQVSDTIRVAEGFHEKRLSHIADTLASRPDIRIICIAGPSSSGKTTFIKRLRVQLQVNGIDPVTVSLDDYYRDRDFCPRDENGEYDFEALEALDLALLASQIRRLLDGESVCLARFDFKNSKSLPDGGREVSLGPTTLLMLEGIHGLNPRLLGEAVDPSQVYRIFIQPMASLAFDRLSRVNPSDLRLLRRIVRDRHTRNCSAADNIARWPSVRRGEHQHIFPYIPQADAVFDTSLVYELSVLKVYAERYLLEVPRSDPSFATAFRLRQLIDHFVAIYPDHVPPTSILREFIGASSFEY